MGFFDKLKDIDRQSKAIRRMTYVILSLSLLMNAGVALYSMYALSSVRSEIYVLTSAGDAMLAESQSVKENRPIEAVAHTTKFLHTFFEINKHSYEEKTAAAINMGSSCIYNLYQKLSNENWYKNVVQYNVVQSIRVESIECITQTSPYIVESDFMLILDSEIKQWECHVRLRFELKDTGNYRNKENPHALSIEDISVLEFSDINEP